MQPETEEAANAETNESTETTTETPTNDVDDAPSPDAPSSDAPEPSEKEKKAKLAEKMAKMAQAGAVGSNTSAMAFGIRDLGFAMSQARDADDGGSISVKGIAKQAERIHARTKYTLEDLQGKQIEGVDPDLKEEYLNDDEFDRAFGMERETFMALPVWKRRAAKKKVNLF